MIKALILYGYGINCDGETQFAFQMAGAQAERVHFNELRVKNKRLKDYQILAFPGGFSHGDDIAAGRVMANLIKTEMLDDMLEFINSEKLVLGICNGFQILAKAGLLPGCNGNYKKQEVTLTYNDSGRFEDRWVYLKVQNDKCVFTRGIDKLYLPVRHGEGKFLPQDETVLKRLYQNNQITAKYVSAAGKENPAYSANPNGSCDGIAGICDESGRIFGFMPHPEAYLFKTNHPRWTRDPLPNEGQGLQLFKNAVAYFK